MFVMGSILLCGACFCVAWLLTKAVRHIALSIAANKAAGSTRVALIDVPNHRSSHSTVTPRGGGVAVVITFTLVLAGLTWSGHVPPVIALGIAVSSLIVGVLGFVDDCGFTLSARSRLLWQFSAAAGLLCATHGVPPFRVFGLAVELGWVGNVLAAIYLVWMVNLFNFMDGIDGIASIEVITVALGGAFVWWLGTRGEQWLVPAALAAAMGGFLVWNRSPARIFLGDSGSCFLGMLLGAISIWSGWQASELFWSWATLMGCFVVDATLTLVRRLLRGHRFDEAHRSHAYQNASRQWHSHMRVSVAFGIVNICWLLPLASLIALKHLDGVAGMLIAYVPLVFLALKLKAGAAGQA